MQKQMISDMNATRLADAAFATSRQVWLAGLGAAAVTRQWARKEAGNTFRALIKEGSAVETQAMRVLGNGVGTSLATANSIWTKTRDQLRATVTTLADTAAAAMPHLKAVTTARKAPVAKPRKAGAKTASKRSKPVVARAKRKSGRAK